MAKNREMLKEAIAEAKAVKEMAIANAKAALEEAFTPQLKSMLSLKLQEMESDDIKEYAEEHEDPETKKRVTAKDVTENEEGDVMEVDLEELLAELEQDELKEGEEEEENLQEAKDEDENKDEDEEISDDELKEMIEDVLAQMIKDGDIEAGPNFESEEGEEGEEGKEEASFEEEDVDLAELLREIEEMGEETSEDKEIEDAFANVTESILKEEPFPAGPELAAILGGIAALISSGVAYVALRSYAERKAKEGAKKWQKILKVVNGLGSAAGGATRIDETEEELAEAKSTIETLRSELNEINLLNAKLLYSNKIFKSKNLNENQKVKVLSSFDKANNVSEVKLVYETLNEGIKVKKETIKENLGRASKTTVTPTVKQPIVESNEAFLRMQKLAGIIK